MNTINTGNIFTKIFKLIMSTLRKTDQKKSFFYVPSIQGNAKISKSPSQNIKLSNDVKIICKYGKIINVTNYLALCG